MLHPLCSERMINPHTRIATILFAVVAITISACKKQEDSTTDYDNLLAEALIEASDGEGTSYFRFPASDDFANIPQDPNNPLNAAKVELGKLLYHETGIALAPKDGQYLACYSCASCHHAAGGFQANVAQGIGEGGLGFGAWGEGRYASPSFDEDSLDVQPIRSPSALNVAYQEVMLWNGQFGATGPNEGTESAWAYGTPKEVNNLGYHGVESQAIEGLKVHRMKIDENWITAFPEYVTLFENAFPNVPSDELYTRETAGLAIAAYERTLFAQQAPFQRWLRGDRDALTNQQKRGAIWFFGKANCASCHTGPALNSMEFYALGMKDFELGVHLQLDPTKLPDRGRGGFTGNAEDDFKFKVPQLYNLKDSPFYGHGSSFTSLSQVIEYKNTAEVEHAQVPASQLADGFVPLNLTQQEVNDIVQFLEYGLHDPNLDRYEPSELPSGNCFPNNDVPAQQDLGCQ